MSSIAIKCLLAAGLFVALGADAGAAQAGHAPRFTQDPVLGLTLPTAGARLEPVPDAVRALCVQMADNDNWTARQWVFGKATDAATASTYYLVGGYFKRRHPTSGEGLYLQPEDGGLYRVKDEQCSGDPARESFAVRDPKQVPPEVLRQLAADFAARLARAAGGEERLRSEIKRRHLKFGMLSPELQEALRPYFPAQD